jgi:hypothetical protein
MSVILKREDRFWYHEEMLRNNNLIPYEIFHEIGLIMSRGVFNVEILLFLSEHPQKRKKLSPGKLEVENIYINQFHLNASIISEEILEWICNNLNLEVHRRNVMELAFHFDRMSPLNNSEKYKIATDDLFTQIFVLMKRNIYAFLDFNKVLCSLFVNFPGAIELFLIAR